MRYQITQLRLAVRGSNTRSIHVVACKWYIPKRAHPPTSAALPDASVTASMPAHALRAVAPRLNGSL
eukprot:9487378-Pyramimonas_sp.AAC.1